MQKIFALTMAAAATMLSACANERVGYGPLEPLIGEAVEHNAAAQIAYGEARLVDLSAEFRAQTDEVVTFPFDSARLEPAARAALQTQIAWLHRHPNVRMSVIGHADLVGPDAYNYRLGLRRARAVVDHMVAHGISRNRLDEIVSRGENDPLIPTEQRERRNRRVVTEVAGLDRQFVGFGMDGRKARAIYLGALGLGG